MYNIISITGILAITILSFVPEIGAQKKFADNAFVDVDPPKVEWNAENR